MAEVMTFTTLIEVFGDGSIVSNVLLPFVGPGQYRFIAGVNRRMKYLYDQFLHNQEREKDREHSTNGNIVFNSLSLTNFYVQERKVEKNDVWLCNYLALHANLELLKFYHGEGFAMDKRVRRVLRNLLSFAAEGGSFEVVQWARTQGCQWDRWTTAHAAKGGHLELLRWVRENGCVWDKWTTSNAAWEGHLEVLQWARHNGCEWDVNTTKFAALGGQLEVLQWARANGCEWDHYTCAYAATKGHLDVLQWAVSNGCKWDRHICLREARLSKFPEIAEWITGNFP